jgi:hypothetical protein
MVHDEIMMVMWIFPFGWHFHSHWVVPVYKGFFPSRFSSSLLSVSFQYAFSMLSLAFSRLPNFTSQQHAKEIAQGNK